MESLASKAWALVLVSVLCVGSFSVAGMRPSLGEESLAAADSGPTPLDTGTTPRTVLAELFTEWGCGPCVNANPPLNRLGDEYSDSQLALLYFHMSWPSGSDPLYWANPGMNNDRRFYYGISGVPNLKLDGTIHLVHNGALTYDLYRSNIASELLEFTNIRIDLTANITSTLGSFRAEITATDPVTETALVARAYLWEDDKWAAGPNGEVRHRYVARESVLESPFMISQGQTVTFENSFFLDPSWDKRRLGIAVFVQSDTTMRVLQAATHNLVPEGVLLVHDSHDMSMEVSFNETLTYNGISYEMYNEQGIGDDSFNDMKFTPPIERMSNYGAIVWHTSSVSFDTLNPLDESRLQTYLNSYGNLFITGENIGSELNNNPFYQNYLHGDFISDTSDSLIEGVFGDPISWKWPPGNMLSIAGTSPEVVNPADLQTSVSFTYFPSNDNGALRAIHDSDSRVVYFPFMYFEGTSRFDLDRDIMMKSILNWLDNASAPLVDVTDPEGGERLIPLARYDIEWTARDVSIPEDGVRIEYTLDSGAPVWFPIAAGEPNDGIFTWVVPTASTTRARVRVCVSDSMGQENCEASDADFIISDDFDPPEISSVLVDGLPSVTVPAGQSITLTAVLSDSTTGGSDIEKANYTIGAQNWPGTQMYATDGTFNSPTENVNATISTTGWPTGDYNLYVYGCDEIGNCIQTSSEYATITISVGDAQPPQISNVNIDGETAKTYYLSAKPPTIMLEATVDDSATGNSPIAGANYTTPSPMNWPGIDMNASDGGFGQVVEIVESTISTPGVGSHDFYVYAQDNVPNYNNTAPSATLIIIDDVPPEIRNVYINGNPVESIQEGTGSVELTAVIDDSMTGGSGVQASNYTVGVQNWPGTEMDPTDGSWGGNVEAANRTIDTSSFSPGIYDICVYGEDASALQNANLTGDCAQLTVEVETGSPEILNIRIDGQSVRTVGLSSLPASFDLTATVDDTTTGNSNISGANYTTPTPNSWPGIPMNASDSTFDSPIENIIVTIDCPAQKGTYPYHVYAWDEKGNFNNTAPSAVVIVQDDIPPEISNALVNGMGSITVSQGTALTLTATAIDVSTGDTPIMAANYTDGVANWPSSLSMSAADASFDSPNEDLEAVMDTGGWTLGIHEIYVYAEDSAGNGNVTSVEHVTVTITPPDTQPPEIVNAFVNENTWVTVNEGESVVLNATVSDENTGGSRIGGANYTIGVQNWPGTPMNAMDGSFNTSFENVTVPIDTTGWSMMNHTVCVYAWDLVPNENTSSTECIFIDVLAVKPLPPIMIGADLVGIGLSDVLIGWNRSGDDGLGRDDVTKYDIFASLDYSGPYFYISSIPATDSAEYNWTCNSCGVGDPNGYFFYVEADNGVLTEASPNKASKFTMSLTPGPQLISVPLILSSDDISFVLQTVQFDMAYYYDSSDASDPWKSYMPFKTYKGDLWTVNRTMAFWVNVTQASEFIVAGLVPDTTAITLRAGWNLVGFPSFASAYTVADLKADVNASNVEEPDPTALPYCLDRGPRGCCLDNCELSAATGTNPGFMLYS
jgi:hypothetical protein